MTAEDIYDSPPGTTYEPREALLTLSRPCVGLSFAEPTRERYVACLFPDEPGVRAYEMARSMSSCGLFVRSRWLAFGLEDPRLRAPYVPGRVMVNLIEMAREAGAWRTPKTIGDVQPGDAVFVAGPEHVLLVEEHNTVTAISPGDVEVIQSIDGGQKEDGRHYGIARRVRRVVNGSLVSAGGTPRAVDGWIDWAAVAAKFG